MLNKKSFLNRTLVALGVFVVIVGILALDIFFTNYHTSQNHSWISGRAINSLIFSVLIFLTVLEMRRALGVERIPHCFSWIMWAYAIGLGPSYSLFGFTGILFFTLIVFSASVVTAMARNKTESLIYIAFMLVYPGLFMASLLYINRCASTQYIPETSPLYNFLEVDVWTHLGGNRVAQLLPYNAIGLAFVFAVSTMTDVFAYLVGSLFGKHKLCPQISPKKTVEGAVGGLFGGLFGSAVVFFLFDFCHVASLDWPFFGKQFGLSFHNLSPLNLILCYVVIGLLGSLMTQIGDLLASMVKRYCGIKDYSKILGEHGGIMDRFDGIMLNAVFVATVYMFII